MELHQGRLQCGCSRLNQLPCRFPCTIAFRIPFPVDVVLELVPIEAGIDNAFDFINWLVLVIMCQLSLIIDE